jgi:hypothetical protein
MAWVREWTMPTERPLLISKVSANFYGQRVPRGQRDWSLRSYSRLSRLEPLFFQVTAQLYSRGWEDPVPDHYFSENLVALGIEPGPLDL